MESDLILLIFTLVAIFIALPVKAYTLVTMNKQGWLTRHADLIGGDGQSAQPLEPIWARSFEEVAA